MHATAIANQKGGVGKTTTTINLAAALAAGVDGRPPVPVLVVDLDPQCNATEGLGVDPSAVAATAFEVLHQDRAERVPLAEAIVPTDCGAQLLAAHKALAGIDQNGAGPGGERLLSRALDRARADLPDDVVVLIDCPPSLGRLTVMALAAADEIAAPLSPGPDELKGFARLLDTVDDVTDTELNTRLRVAHVLLTCYDARTRLSRDVEHKLRETFPREYAGTIAQTVQVGESTARRQPVLTYRPDSRAAQDYVAFATLYLQRLGRDHR